ncbi:hypothetical protein [Acinetobacter junii]|uniref:hypothetical protein n=1 Tax=Acinetobacter junii TaxID=40215 RepID=UPI003018DDC1
MTCIETISLLANIATLLGLIFAIYVFFQWKRQSDYSFKRDVIFEAELATLDTFAALITTIQTYSECKRIYLVNGNNQDPQFLRQDYIEKKKQLDQKIQTYHENLVKLNISNINLDESIILNKNNMISKFESIITDIHAINNPDDIPVKLNEFILEIGLLSNNSTEFLSKTRKNI